MDYKDENVWLLQGDFLERLPDIDLGKVALVLTDPPFGTTKCKWDSIIDLPSMWSALHGLKETTPIVLCSAQPFTSVLVCSNLKDFKYDWVWEKPSAKGHLNAKKQPMRAHESLLVFYKKQCQYNPIMVDSGVRKVSYKHKNLNSDVYNANTKDTYYDSTLRYPRSVQLIKQDTQKSSLHPTQKPVELMEYMVKTYTKVGDTVLDFTMGSGTTGVACKNLKRKFIGIELDEEYFKIAKQRILGD